MKKFISKILLENLTIILLILLVSYIKVFINPVFHNFKSNEKVEYISTESFTSSELNLIHCNSNLDYNEFDLAHKILNDCDFPTISLDDNFNESENTSNDEAQSNSNNSITELTDYNKQFNKSLAIKLETFHIITFGNTSGEFHNKDRDIYA